MVIYEMDDVLHPDQESQLGEHFLGNWVEENASFLFFSREAEEEIASLAQGGAHIRVVDRYELDYEEWQGKGSEEIRVPPFLITVPGRAALTGAGEIRIALEPGVVFGNGLHPTTRDCLRALAFACRVEPFATVLDLGTGTGILSLAAACLGAKRVLAVDVNPLCVQTARKNCILNGVEDRVRVVEGEAAAFLGEPGDLVVANMHYRAVSEVMKERDPGLHKRFLLSGLLRSQARDLKADLGRLRYTLIREWNHEMTWHTLLLKGDERALRQRKNAAKVV